MAVSNAPVPVRKMTTGRGGAAKGNIGTSQIQKPNTNLDTPLIKASMYTTGRGGKGNMAHNNADDPSEARRAQDVSPIMRRGSHSSAGSSDGGANPRNRPTGINTGRGGRGNVVRTGSFTEKVATEVEKRGRSVSAGEKVMGALKRMGSRGSQRSVRSAGSGSGRLSEEVIRE
ncbi:MAG: hypothetical protein M1828_005486 [Chrysothrix sp. TS-e1954]|nr:MAG: hypothetical protein M1828_005486 [Chrysothrix sp. TS-e1954]